MSCDEDIFFNSKGLNNLGDEERRVVLKAINGKEKEGSKLVMPESAGSTRMSDAEDDDQQCEDDNRSHISTGTRESNDHREFTEALTKFSKALETMTAANRELTTTFMSGINHLSDLIQRFETSKNCRSGCLCVPNKNLDTNMGVQRATIAKVRDPRIIERLNDERK